jgi:hypothetical protein
MRRKLVVTLLGTGFLLAALPVWAHHAFSSEFDINKPLTLKGTFTKWEMINPHSWFHIDVKNPDGTVTEWRGCPRVARAGAVCSKSARSAILTDGREAHRFYKERCASIYKDATRL